VRVNGAVPPTIVRRDAPHVIAKELVHPAIRAQSPNEMIETIKSVAQDCLRLYESAPGLGADRRELREPLSCLTNPLDLLARRVILRRSLHGP
jgi:hypothetical protein